MNTTNQKINDLKNKLTKYEIDAFIIPSTDPHQSEYVCDYWKVRAYFSGFTGSAGTLVVTKDEAALWTDSRYFLQFKQECKDTLVKLYKQKVPHAPEHVAWLCNLLSENTTIGVDYRQFSKSQIDYLLSFATPKNIVIKNVPNLVDELWENRPSLPKDKVIEHNIAYSGKSTSSKLSLIKQEIKEEKADYYFVSGLDEIAWLLNIRSNDVDFTPLVISYALISEEKSYLFCDISRFDANLIEILSDLQIEILSYQNFTTHLSKLTKGKTVITDASTLNYAAFDAIEGKVKFKPSSIIQLKSVKNEVEITNAKKCMVKDGVALTKFFIWLEKTLQEKTLTEYEIGKKLEAFRSRGDLYQSDSFAAIVGYNGNGAIIHYTALKEGSATVTNKGVLLIDSGAQYLDGTTDITRTIWLGGTPTEEIKKAYTLVLKGCIELTELEFPEGTVGMQVDALARMHLWKHGLNYGHGTGHGIGSYAMVHEAPQGFVSNMATSRGSSALLENQFTTIEPGCYIENKFGIRTENVVVAKKTKTTAFGNFIGLEPITLCAIDTQLIAKELLLTHEIEWLNNYHKKVYTKLEKHLSKEEKEWLKDRCKAI